MNQVVVSKPNKEWRICIDYTDLSKAISKKPFSLPQIDQVLDVVEGHQVLCFLDAYKGYYQIPMAVEEMEKTPFMTDDIIFCYNKMLFQLKKTQVEFQ